MLALFLVLAGALTVFVQAATADPDSPPYTIVTDESGPNDVPGQKDLTLQGTRYGSAGAPLGTIQVLWNWDETSISGGNTLDACTLFDTNSPSDGKANAALCLTLGNQPLQKLATTLYTCGNGRVDRCSSPITPVSINFGTTCSFSANSPTDPYGGNGKNAGASYPNDTRAKCTIALSDINSSTAVLINTCSYPSQQPNSDPSDCVLIPRDAFLSIVKNAGGDTTTSFNFAVTGGTTASPVVQGGAANAVTVPIKSGVATTLTEASQANWNYVGTSCAGGTNNGTAITNGVSGVTASSDSTVTCTVTNALKPAPQLIITKACPGNTAFPTDRFQPQNNGSNVGSALACGGSATITLTPDTAYNITEAAAGTPTANLSNYTIGYSSACANSSGLPRGATTPTCTITNTLKAAPQLTIFKSCPSGADATTDQFQPLKNGVAAGSALACEGSTTITLTPDTAYNITEAAAGTTNLTDYTAGYSPECVSSAGLSRGASTPTCTITNALKPAPQLKIVKTCPQGADASSDQFQPQNNSVNVGPALACGDSATITLTRDIAYSITEAAAGTTKLSNYNSSLSTACANTAGLPRGAATPTCTITNTLKPQPQLTIAKDCPQGPDTASDRFQAQNGGSDVGPALACGGSTTITLNRDTAYTITEAASGTTELGNYTSSLSPECASSMGLARGASTPVCTISNTLKPQPRLTIAKACPQGADALTDRFQAKNNGIDAGAALACGGSTTITLNRDTAYSITEAASGTTKLSNYTAGYSAECSSSTGLARGADTPTCTITNALKPQPQLTITKSCPNGSYASSDRFQPQNNGVDAGAVLDCGESTTITLTRDTAYSITEAAAGSPAANLANYTKAYSPVCSSSLGLSRGADTPTCTITNTLRTFTVVTFVCEGGRLYASSVSLDGVTKTSTGHNAALPGGITESQLCNDSTVIDARFPNKLSGDKAVTVSIAP